MKVAQDSKLNEGQLRVLYRANATGSIVKLLVTGKYQQPQAFKDAQHLHVE
jgi:hypothetical protein